MPAVLSRPVCFTSPTTPTTSRSLSGKNESFRCRPIGLSLGHNCFAIDWLMTTTDAESAVSLALMFRPLQQRDVHGLDVSGCRNADGHLRLFGHRDNGMPFDRNRLV